METDTQHIRRTTDVTFGIAIVILALVLIGLIGVEGDVYLPWTKAEATSPDNAPLELPAAPALVSATSSATTTPAP